MPAWLVKFVVALADLILDRFFQRLDAWWLNRNQVIPEPTDAPLVKPPVGALPPVVGLPGPKDPR